MSDWIDDRQQRWGPSSDRAQAINPDDFDPTQDEALRGICLCQSPHHAPFCRIGVMIARLATPPNLRRISVT